MIHRVAKLSALSLAFLALCSCHRVQPGKTPATILPLSTLRLYETGVGYFERTGTVSGTASTTLPVPAGHLDDALKTLIVLSTDSQSQVHGLEFSSSVSKGMGLALAGLSPEGDQPITYQKLIASLKGETVRLRTTNGALHGRLIDVIKPAPTAANGTTDESDTDGTEPATKALNKRAELELLLLTTAGEIVRIPTDQLVAVRPTNQATANRLGLALDTVSARTAQSRRDLRILTQSSGPVTLGYITETPIWRTSYRLVLGKKEDSAMLQGWALLHNDTDENWQGVQVHLVSGQPDSFLFPLAAPRYTRRELVAPDEPLSTIPQLFKETADSLWGDFADSDAIVGHAGGGYGGAYGRLGVGHRSRAPRLVGFGQGHAGGTSSSSVLSIGNLAKVSEARGVETPALFTYSFPQKIDLRAHGSALVPFLQRPVEIKRITWIEDQPRSAVQFINTSGQTLPAGPIAFFSNGGFVGESGLDRLKPAERRIIAYGNDLDVTVTNETLNTREVIKKLTYLNDHITTHFVQFSTEAYRIHNRSAHARLVYWPLHIGTNGKVSGADELDFEAVSSRPVAVFRIAARQKVERKLKIELGLAGTSALDTLDMNTLTRWATTTSLPEAERQVVREARSKLKAVQQLDDDIDRIKRASSEITSDLNRLREHLKAMGGSSPMAGRTNPFVTRILAKEDELAKLRKKQQETADQKDRKLDELRDVFKKLGSTT